MFLLLLIAAGVYFGATKDCPENFTLSKVACNNTCSNIFYGQTCTLNLEPGCECDDPFYLNSKEQCVNLSDCDPSEVRCPANAEYKCVTKCQKSCQNLYQEVSCNGTCTNTCGCKTGYVSNGTNACVLPHECKPDDIKCPKGLIVNPCGNGVTNTCENLYDDISTSSRPCLPSCTCLDNKVYDTKTKKCVDARECENSYENEDCGIQDPNMVYSSHPPNPPMIGTFYHRGCACKRGFSLDYNNNTCISV